MAGIKGDGQESKGTERILAEESEGTGRILGALPAFALVF